MHRLPELEQHVVGHIDDRADGSDAGATQVLAHPDRSRRAIVDTAEDASHELGAGLGRIQMNREDIAMRRLDRLDPGPGQCRPRQCSDLARNTDDRHRVTAIRRDIQLQHAVIEPEVIPKRLTERRVLRQLEDAGRGIGQAELLGRGQHPEGFDAAQLGRLDVQLAGQLGADGRQGRLQPGARIRCSANDLQRWARPHGNTADL